MGPTGLQSRRRYVWLSLRSSRCAHLQVDVPSSVDILVSRLVTRSRWARRAQVEKLVDGVAILWYAYTMIEFTVLVLLQDQIQHEHHAALTNFVRIAVIFGNDSVGAEMIRYHGFTPV